MCSRMKLRGWYLTMSVDSGITLSSDFHRDREHEPGVNGPLLCAIHQWASAYDSLLLAQPFGVA